MLTGNRLALIIGVDEYKDPHIPQLPGVGFDARGLDRRSRDPDIGNFKTILLVGEEVRDYRELGHLQSTIKRAKDELSALDASDKQKQSAVTTLMNLQMAGFSEKDITELTECVNTWKARSGIATLDHINGNNGNGKKLDDKLIGVEY
jgi:hypothetical protein